mgnify:CR=1 FL=1
MDEVTTFNFDQASWEDLRTEAKRLALELETLKNKSRYTEQAFANRERQRTEAAEICQRLIEEKVITDEDDIKGLVEALGLDITREVNFTITVEITGTLELAYGEELDEYSFDVDSLTYNGDLVDIDHSRVESVDWDEV